jgi:excisionase family DNA binding protein
VDDHHIPPAVLKIAQALIASGIDIAAPSDPSTTPSEPPASYRVREIADELKVDDSTVYRWIEKGRLRAYRFEDGGSIRVPAEEFEAFKRRGLMRSRPCPRSMDAEAAS